MAAKQLTVEFGIIKNYPETEIVYKGDVDTGVTITIDALGPASGFRINNTTTGDFIILDSAKIKAITGADISAYDQITINTNKGSKSARLLRNGVTYNILHAVNRTSKWITLNQGSNKFTYTATSGLNDLNIFIYHYVKVLGV